MTKNRHQESESDDQGVQDGSLSAEERLRMEIELLKPELRAAYVDYKTEELEITPLEMEWYRWQAKKAWFGGVAFLTGWLSVILGFCITAFIKGFRSDSTGLYFLPSTQDVIVVSIVALVIMASGFLLYWTQIFPKTPVKMVIDGVAEQVTKGGIELEGMFVLRPPSAPPIQSNRKYTGEGFYVEKKIGGCILPTKLNGWELTQRDITVSKTKGVGWHWLLFVVPQGIWPLGFRDLRSFENFAFSAKFVAVALPISEVVYFTLLVGAIAATSRSIFLGIRIKRKLRKP